MDQSLEAVSTAKKNVYVWGRPGAGKSTLLAKFQDVARARGEVIVPVRVQHSLLSIEKEWREIIAASGIVQAVEPHTTFERLRAAVGLHRGAKLSAAFHDTQTAPEEFLSVVAEMAASSDKQVTLLIDELNTIASRDPSGLTKLIAAASGKKALRVVTAYAGDVRMLNLPSGQDVTLGFSQDQLQRYVAAVLGDSGITLTEAAIAGLVTAHSLNLRTIKDFLQTASQLADAGTYSSYKDLKSRIESNRNKLPFEKNLEKITAVGGDTIQNIVLDPNKMAFAAFYPAITQIMGLPRRDGNTVRIALQANYRRMHTEAAASIVDTMEQAFAGLEACGIYFLPAERDQIRKNISTRSRVRKYSQGVVMSVIMEAAKTKDASLKHVEFILFLDNTDDAHESFPKFGTELYWDFDGDGRKATDDHVKAVVVFSHELVNNSRYVFMNAYEYAHLEDNSFWHVPVAALRP